MTILVVEDGPVQWRLLRTLLQPHTLIEAASAEQAIRLFIDNDRQIDLLITDVTLPTISGIQVALILCEAIPALPVILASGYPVSEMRVRDYADLGRLSLEPMAVIQKPFQARALLDTVRELTDTNLHNKTRTA